MNYTKNGQLSLFDFPVRQKIPSRMVKREILLKLEKADPQISLLKKLNQFARENKALEFITSDGIWIVRAIGKTETGYYLWNLYVRPFEPLAV
jgi:hypothetical protein